MSLRRLSGFKQLLSLLVIGILFVSIYSQAVEASVVFGPVQYARATGSPGGRGIPISNGSSEISNGSNTVYASPVYGPEELTNTAGSTQDLNFTIDHPHGNYTLYVRNGDLTGNGNASSSAEVWLNGAKLFGPGDFKKQGGLLKKNVSPGTNNQLRVNIRGEPGSHIYVWIEDESPDIVITSPLSDTVTNGMITVFGYTTDHTVKTVVIAQSNNSTPTSVPVSNGNFTTGLYIHAPVKLTISATDSTGSLRTTTLCLDGDYLPMQAELQYGFDPLNPDSDSKLTTSNESANGITDGFEILNNQSGELLPAFMKYMLNGDPLKVDSNGNGLMDYFEFAKLGVMDVGSNSSIEMALTGEDPDHDGLSNLQEQSLGTDPLVADTDGDELSDGYEVNISHTNPLLSDTDGDSLDDATELRLGTDPNNPDTNGNGIPDSNEMYTTTTSNSTLGVSVSITGIGDMSRQTTIVRETSEYYTNNPALVSLLADVNVSGQFDHAVVSMQYDSNIIKDPSNYSLCYYNESLGLFLPVPSMLDPVNHTISANVTHLSIWGIFNLNTLADLYSNVATFNDAISGYVNGSASIIQNIINNPYIPLTVTKTYTVNSSTGTVSISDKAAFAFGGATVNGPAPTPTPAPAPTSQDYSPILITMNNKGKINWFGQGASYPPGMYQINATGWYTHWYPPASTLACIDQGPDQNVRMYAWSNRGNNYPYPGVSDANRLGMHLRYGSNDSPVYAIRIAPGTLQFNHSGGKIGIWDNDDNYDDNTYSLSYILSYVGNTTPVQNMADSDGDGLPDELEIHGWKDTQGSVHITDPYDSDSDGDGLSDCQEAGAWAIVNGLKYFRIVSDPNNADSDGDGLSDYEEVNGTTIYVANTHDSAQNFMNAIQQGNDATQYLTALTVTSNPLNNQSDTDEINDGDEIAMGTSPSNSDTDEDGIPDNKEAIYGEDPTIFDVTPPSVSLGDWNVYKDSFSLTMKYYFMYTVTDPGGVKDISVVKNDVVKDSGSYPRGIIAPSRTTYFDTDWETLLDSIRTAKVDVNSGDWNGNSGSVMVYHRSSMYGQWAAQIGSDTFLSGDTASSLGALSGFSGAVAETPGMVAQIANDPAGYLDNIKKLTSSLASDPALLGQLVSSLPQTIKDEQELENPYSADNALHANFAEGWYSGYIAGQLFMMWAGGEVVKSIASSEQFARISDSVLSKLDDAKAALKASETFGVTSKVGTLLVEKSTSFSSDVMSKVLEKVPTAAKKALVSKYFGEIGYSARPALNGYETELGKLIAMTPGDAANIIKATDDVTLNNVLSLEVLNGVKQGPLEKLKVNLLKLYTDGTITSPDVLKFITNVKKLDGKNGLDSLVKRIYAARTADNFQGAAFEAEFAADNPDKVLALGMRTGGTPGDIDVLMSDGGQKVAYECKTGSFGINDKYDILDKNKGFQLLVQKGTINEYKIMFREKPSQDVIDWLNGANPDGAKIPWDYFVK